MLDKLKTAIVLVVIAAVSGILIFGTNELTKDRIMENHLAREQSFYKEIFDINEDTIITPEYNDLEELEEEIIIIDDNDQIIGYIYKGYEKNSYGEITVLVGIDLDGTIRQVIISSTTNTPTFVKIIETNYLMLFEGQDTTDVSYDERTGATYTYGSVQKFVDAASKYYAENRGDAS